MQTKTSKRLLSLLLSLALMLSLGLPALTARAEETQTTEATEATAETEVPAASTDPAETDPTETEVPATTGATEETTEPEETDPTETEPEEADPEETTEPEETDPTETEPEEADPEETTEPGETETTETDPEETEAEETQAEESNEEDDPEATEESNNMLLTAAANTTNVAKIGETEYVSLTAAISAADAGDTVTLLDSVSETSVTVSKNLTIDLNNKTLSTTYVYVDTSGVEVTVKNGTITGTYGAYVTDGTLTLDSCTLSLTDAAYAYGGELKLVSTTLTSSTTNRAINCYDSSTVTIDANSTVNCASGTGVVIWGDGSGESAKTPTLNVYGKINAIVCISGNGTDYSGTKINLYSGAVLTATQLGMYLPQPCTVNITGATVTGVYGAIGMKSGTLTISGNALIQGTGSYDSGLTSISNGINTDGSAIIIDSYSGYAGNVTVTIQADESGNTPTITSANAVAVREISNSASTNVVSISVSSGTVTGAVSAIDVTTAAKDYVTITGGTYSSDVSDYYESAYTTVTNADGSVTVVTAESLETTAVASITSGETTTYYSSLAAAVDAAAGATITILQDISEQETIWFENGKSAVIDLNNHTIAFAFGAGFKLRNGSLTLTGTGTVQEQEGGFYYAPIMLNGMTDENGSNTLVIDTGVTLKGWAGIFVNNNSSYTNYSMNVTFSGKIISGVDTYGDAGHGIYLNGAIVNQDKYPTITITNTAVIEGDGEGIYAAGYGVWNIEGGTITSLYTGIEIRAGVLNISGGTITSTSTTFATSENGNGTTVCGAGVAISQHSTDLPLTVNITGGTISGYYGVYEWNSYEGHTSTVNLSISGEDTTVTATGSNGEAVYSKSVSESTNDCTTVEISGGTFSTDVTEYCTDGCAAIYDSASEKYGIQSGVAAAYDGDTCKAVYSTLKAAIEAATDGQTVKLIDDITESVEISSTSTTLDLNGHELTSASAYTVNITGTGTLTIVDSLDGGAISNTKSGGNAIYVNSKSATLNVESGTIKAVGVAINVNAGTVNLSGGTFEGGAALGGATASETVVCLKATTTDCTVTVTGGFYNGYAFAKPDNATSPISVSGGYYTVSNWSINNHLASGCSIVADTTYDGYFYTVSAQAIVVGYYDSEYNFTAVKGYTSAYMYNALQYACDQTLENGQTAGIVLYADYTTASVYGDSGTEIKTITIPESKTIILDLNGYTVGDSAAQRSAIAVSVGATLTIIDSSGGSGTVTSANTAGGTIRNYGGTLTINSGTYVNKDQTQKYSPVIYSAVATTDTESRTATNTINGGTFSSYGRIVHLNIGSLTVNDGEFTAKAIYYKADSNSSEVVCKSIVIASETLEADASGEGRTLNTYVVNRVASVTSGETTAYYKTLSEALSAATSGETVTLLTDITLSEAVTASTSGEVTIDLAGNDLTISNATLTVSEGTKIVIEDSASSGLVTNNGTIAVNGTLDIRDLGYTTDSEGSGLLGHENGKISLGLGASGVFIVPDVWDGMWGDSAWTPNWTSATSSNGIFSSAAVGAMVYASGTGWECKTAFNSSTTTFSGTCWEANGTYLVEYYKGTASSAKTTTYTSYPSISDETIFAGWYSDSDYENVYYETSGVAYARFVKLCEDWSDTIATHEAAVINFLGGSLRMDTDTTGATTNLRFGYDIIIPSGFTSYSWSWSVSVKGSSSSVTVNGVNYTDVTSTTYGDGIGTEQFCSNVVIEEVSSTNYQTVLCSKLTVTFTTADGTTVTATESGVRERSVYAVANAIKGAGEGDTDESKAAYAYAEKVLGQISNNNT